MRILIASIVIMVVASLSADAAPANRDDAMIAFVDCGADIATPGLYRLDEDLNCTGTSGANITLRSGVTLDLQSHTVRCFDGTGTGVRLLGTHAVLRNGLITDCTDGVVLGPSGDHLVLQVTADATIAFGMGGGRSDGNHVVLSDARGAIGFAINGDENVLFRDSALSPMGYRIDGNANRVTRSAATAATGVSIIGGSGNQIARNLLVGEDFGVGLHPIGVDVLAGSQHRIVRNTLRDGPFDVGIRVGAEATCVHVARNVSHEATVDLVDETPGCGCNTWQRNLFDTTNQPACVR